MDKLTSTTTVEMPTDAMRMGATETGVRGLRASGLVLRTDVGPAVDSRGIFRVARTAFMRCWASWVGCRMPVARDGARSSGCRRTGRPEGRYR